MVLMEVVDENGFIAELQTFDENSHSRSLRK